MLKLSRALFLEEPDAEVLDHYERATVNHILSSLHPKRRTGVLHTGAAGPLPRGVDAPELLLVLRRHRAGKPREVRRAGVHHRGRRPVRQPLHRLPAQPARTEPRTGADRDSPLRRRGRHSCVRGAPATPVAIHLRVPGWHEGTPQVRINGAPPEDGTRPAHHAPRSRRTAPDLRASGAAVARRGHGHHAPSPTHQRRTAPRRLAVGVVPLRAHRPRGRRRPQRPGRALRRRLPDGTRRRRPVAPPGAPARRARPEHLRSGGRRAPTRPGPAGVRPGPRGRATG